MQRLQLLKDQLYSKKLSSSKPQTNNVKETRKPRQLPKPLTAYEYLDFDSFLTKEEIEYRKSLHEFLINEIQPKMNEHHNNSSFPIDLIKKISNKFPGLNTMNLKQHKEVNIPELKQMSDSLAFVCSLELFRCDIALATMFMHQTSLVLDTLLHCGSKAQIEKYSRKLIKYELLGSWNLTEPDFGSDATSLKTNAIKDDDCFVLNGEKRWAANVPVADFFIIWAQYENNLRGFIVDANSQGLSRSKIEGKLSLRAVQNGDVKLNNVRIPLENILPYGENFSKGLSKMLLKTRIGTGIGATGACIQAFDVTIDYLSKRIQFGKPLTSFQMIQEKLVKCISNIQAMLYFSKRTYDLSFSNEGVSMGRAGLCKSFCTQKARETIRMLREMWGGNGIISTNLVMRYLTDIESLHTYEGTFEINTLIAGREITGISAFK